MSKNKGKIDAVRILFFIFLVVTATAIIGYFLKGNFEAYQAEVSILLVPKNENITNQIDLVTENILELSKRQFDYQAGNIKAFRNGKSSILTLAAFGNSEQSAETLGGKSADDLILTASRYYNIKTDLDFRLISKAPARLAIQNWYKFLGICFTLGLISALSLWSIFWDLKEKLLAFWSRKKKRMMILGAGWTFDRTTNFAFEYLLYPIVIGYWGILLGGGIMIASSTILSLGTIWLYDWLKKDWLGIEAIKTFRDEDQKSKTAKLASWLMKKGDLAALIVLSIYSEPVKVALYMRRGANQFNGFSKRDWLIFTTAVVIGNVSWALLVWGGLSALRILF